MSLHSCASMRAVLRVDPPLLRDVFEHSLNQAGIDVVDTPSDTMELLVAVKERQPEVVFLTAQEVEVPPGICGRLLSEFPQLKVVMLSNDKFAVADVGVRLLQCDDLSVESIRTSLLKILSD